MEGRVNWPRLPGNVPAGSRTRDLSITSPTPYHYTTEADPGRPSCFCVLLRGQLGALLFYSHDCVFYIHCACALAQNKLSKRVTCSDCMVCWFSQNESSQRNRFNKTTAVNIWSRCEPIDTRQRHKTSVKLKPVCRRSTDTDLCKNLLSSSISIPLYSTGTLSRNHVVCSGGAQSRVWTWHFRQIVKTSLT